MPEGPEIAREADRLRDALEGHAVERVRFAFPHLARRAGRFAGATVERVRPRGKALLIGFDNGFTVYSHNQLYGRWFVQRAGTLPQTGRQLRLAIETANRWALLYSASEIEVLDAAGLANHAYLRNLGPDALDETLEAVEVEARLRDARFVGRSLAALLLDQRFVAGLGNYLRSEIAFEAGVHPARRPRECSRAELRRLSTAILRVTRRAYRHRGVTQPLAQHRAQRREGASFGRARHWVFARAGAPCRRCARTVERVDLAGRRVYLCARCQPASGRGDRR